MRKKVTVIGAGNVGANTAQKIAAKELADAMPLFQGQPGERNTGSQTDARAQQKAAPRDARTTLL